MNAVPSETIDFRLALVSMHSAFPIRFSVSFARVLMISKQVSQDQY